VTQQEGTKLLARTTLREHRVLASSQHISQCLDLFVGRRHRHEHSHARKARELRRIPAVGLHPIATDDGSLRGRDDNARNASRRERTAQAEARRARLIGDVNRARLAELTDPPHQPRNIVRHLAQLANRHAPTGSCYGDGYGVFVNVQTDVLRYLLHVDRLPCGSAPRLREQSQRNPRLQEARSTHPV
jgi:hypothetical protein